MYNTFLGELDGVAGTFFVCARKKNSLSATHRSVEAFWSEKQKFQPTLHYIIIDMRAISEINFWCTSEIDLRQAMCTEYFFPDLVSNVNLNNIRELNTLLMENQ